MSAHYDSARLAGLDAMVLHISNQSSGTPTSLTNSLDDIPYVKIPRVNACRRASRTPLADRTLDLNFSHQRKHAPSSKHPILAKHTPSIYQDNSKDQGRKPPASRFRPSYTQSSSFKPLPPVPSASSLQIPSFLDFSCHSTTPLLDPTPQLPSTLLASVIPSQSAPFTLADDVFKEIVNGKPQRKVHDEPYLIPAFQHPNSPYVPWTPPIRHQILRPFMSSLDSRSYDRSSARAPELGDDTETSTTRGNKPLNVAWSSIRRTVTATVKHVTRRIKMLNKTSKGSAETSHVYPSPSRFNSNQLSSPEMSFSGENYSPSSIPPMAALSAHLVIPSTASFHSSDTATLDAWLASRQRTSLERDYEPETMMSFDDYELKGSWLNLSRADEEGVTSCGVPGCKIHDQRVSNTSQVIVGQPTPMAEDAGYDVWSTGLYETSRRIVSVSSLGSELPRPHSFSHLPSRSVWFDSEVQLTRKPMPFPCGISNNRGALSPILGGRRERELSMPGGWTFAT